MTLFQNQSQGAQLLNIENRSWSSHWITHPDAEQREYGVYHFRKSIFLSTIPKTFCISLSADNRYRLYVNGVPLHSGPARGCLSNWFFETVDIASYLKEGKNTIAVLVWNMGEFTPVAQISNQTAFIMQGNSSTEKMINTDSTWKVMMNDAYMPCSTNTAKRLGVYFVSGPGDQVNGVLYPWGWEKPDYNDAAWNNAKEIMCQKSPEHKEEQSWNLVPRTIPLFKEYLSRFRFVRRTGGKVEHETFINGKRSLTIPAHQVVNILLDNSVNTVAYPEIILSAGKGASVKLTYAESLFDEYGNKGNRNEIENKMIAGNYDIFNPDGGENRLFRPLWFRTYRYLQMNINTSDEPLIIEDIYSMTTGYPFQVNASFSCNDSSLHEIWNVGWRTAQLCAGELYYDTPYYEQLQYAGDSRIQALISLYISGDDRLMKKAILDFYYSRIPEGLTQSRYPSSRLQVIPAFSLFWISMVYDFWMHRKDNMFIVQFFPVINDILQWFSEKIDMQKKMLGPLTWWNFVDWDNFNGMGAAPGSENGNSSIVTLQYIYTLNQAIDLLNAFDYIIQANEYKKLADELAQGTIKQCYNRKIGLVADTPEQSGYSQHAGIWAILSGALPESEIRQVMSRLLKEKTIGQVTLFYRFYLVQALKKAEMADLYYSELTPWRDMLKLGLTTFAEKSEPARSDCHAWSASPNYDFLATICGIMPDAPGFEAVIIKPALGELNEVEGTVPHPLGKIQVNLKRLYNKGIYAKITLPEKLMGTFIWEDKKNVLHSGIQVIVL